jgi:transposase
VRVRRSLAEKRRIVELTLRPGQSVARVAQAEGVNSHQVFQWRRAYGRGLLGVPENGGSALLPVMIQPEPAGTHEGHIAVTEQAVAVQPAATGSIHIELPGLATISVEHGANLTLLRAVLESLRK